MRSLGAAFRTLTLPFGAPATAPAIVLGPDVPPLIATDPHGQAVSAAIIYRMSNEVFFFDAITQAVAYSGMLRWTGSVNTAMPVGNQVYWSQLQGPGVPGEDWVDEIFGDLGPTADRRRFHWNFYNAQIGYGGNGSHPNAVLVYADDIEMPRGIRASASWPTSSASITTETVVASVACTLIGGCAYELLIGGRYTASAAGKYVTPRIRLTDVSGTVIVTLGSLYVPTAGLAGMSLSERVVIGKADTGDLSTTLALTFATTAGSTVTHVGSSDRPRFMELRHLGAVSDHANAIVL